MAAQMSELAPDSGDVAEAIQDIIEDNLGLLAAEFAGFAFQMDRNGVHSAIISYSRKGGPESHISIKLIGNRK
jgi:hypothetical protein